MSGVSRRSIATIVAGTVALALCLMTGIAVWVWTPIDPALLSRDAVTALTIEDRHGAALRSTRSADGSQASWVPFADIDPDIVNAFVAVEDRRFWTHHGIDWRAVGRATRDNLRARRVVSGASTISMQLARLLVRKDRDWGGKLGQALWALRLEHHLTKQQLLEEYLNRVHLGQGASGVGAATSLYFSASATNVGVGQAATLAGLAHAPARDNPYASAERARRRRSVALQRMRSMGYATEQDVARATAEPLVSSSPHAPFLAPHFTTRVLAWTEASSTTAVPVLRTSLDLELQTELEGEVRHTVSVLSDRAVKQAAVVVLDNATGEVLAWVGSPGFWSADDGQTDMVVSPRQPGSALKPFVYGLALDRGYTAATILPDVPRAYATVTGPYQPRNYDRRFRGPVRAREALASSYNVPAVELAARVGVGSVLNTMHLAGFVSLRRDAEYYGLGLALGNGDVTLIELANAYRALANGGVWRPWTWRAAAGAGAPATDQRRVLSPIASAIILDMLADPGARVPGFGVITPFDFPFPVAVKTGTSRHFTDNWAVAATRNFTVAVWAGNFNGRPMQGVSGVTGAGPLLHRAVMDVARRLSPGQLVTPGEVGAVPVPVCRLSGMRASPTCSSVVEWFVPGTEPASVDDWERDGRITLPDEYALWAREGLRPTESDRKVATTTRGDSARSEPREPRPVFRILSPLDGDRYTMPSGVEARYATIALRASGASDVRWSVDGAPHDRGRWALRAGEHVIRASNADGESAEVRIVVER